MILQDHAAAPLFLVCFLTRGKVGGDFIYKPIICSIFFYHSIMTNATILVIEGKHADCPTFAPALQKKGFSVELALSGNDALARLLVIDPDLVVVNAVSLRSTGARICQTLRKENNALPLVLILEEGNTPEKTAADVVLNLPFTPQKLVNRIKPLLPGDGKNVLHIGPIRLDMEHRRVKCLGKNARLTPRLVSLLKTLMEHRGEVVEREALFKQVWETDYTGDTRTLDVHISWLRKAIELDPDHPRFLKTIRGVGYRLDA
jgi:DNA-binding response OmpR family regulator